MRNMSDIDRTSTDAEKEGMFTGAVQKSNEWRRCANLIANYVLVDYGT